MPSAASRLLPHAEARPFPLLPELAGTELGRFFRTSAGREVGRNLMRGRTRREGVAWVKESERGPWEPRSLMSLSPPDSLLPSALPLREGGSDNRAKASLMSWGVKCSPLLLPLQDCKCFPLSPRPIRPPQSLRRLGVLPFSPFCFTARTCLERLQDFPRAYSPPPPLPLPHLNPQPSRGLISRQTCCAV